MKIQGNTAKVLAYPSTPAILLNNKVISLSAYNIGDNNYFKLRDIAYLFNFSVVWNSDTNTISIDTTAGYTAPSAS